MNNSGIFKLWCKRSDEHPWGVLESVNFDNASRRKSQRRKGALRKLRTRLSGWVHNFWQFRNASFCIEEQPDAYSLPRHIQGQRRDKVWVKGKGGGLKRKIPKARAQTPVRKLIRKIPKRKEQHFVIEYNPSKQPIEGKAKVSQKVLSAVRRANRAQRKKWKEMDSKKGKRK